MDEQDWLAEQFEAHRTRLRAVAYRMLGSATEADDAVQDAWLRFSHVGANGVNNLGGWLTTLVARACLDLLRAHVAAGAAARRARARPRHQPRGWHRPRAAGAHGRGSRAGAAGGPGDADARRAAGVRATRYVRGALRGDRSHRGTFPDRGTAARQPRTAPGARGEGPRC